MFIRIYQVTRWDHGSNARYTLKNEDLIINTQQIVSIKAINFTPKMSEKSQQEKIEKIYDTKFENLGIFDIYFSDETCKTIIGPKSKFENIK